jgi:uncharacterized protein (TIGR00730 family)
MSEDRKNILKLRQITDKQRATTIKANEAWNLLTIMAEFIDATERLSEVRPAVTIFGSARTKPDDPFYLNCVDLSRRLSDAGFSVISGGGPGIMAAANKGAYEGTSSSIGLNVELPREQIPNQWQNISISFRHFFARKVAFVKYADAYVIYPGGFGTLDEMTEVLTLIQTGKTRHMPVILVGTQFWRGLIDWLRSALLANHMIAEADIDLIQLIDEPAQIVDAIFAFYEALDIEAATDELHQLL